ncbi:hypothetical protein [Pedobacter mucosus]|uniref:hypothetical protein n=1 Tax=Pedobacter mucosus TaxID=2895286 RepID=UPI001EE46A5B|nr:hypothetical protein [Pedobacter mucosus]UKT64809.1 hypothetical protein LOK61_03325 [Pedobacter mucosus]
MKLILENVDTKHYNLLLEMAEALNFKIKELNISEDEDAALGKAVESGQVEGRMDEPSKEEFEKWLGNL